MIVAKTKGSRARVTWASRWVPEREEVQREHEAIEREWNREARERNAELERQLGIAETMLRHRGVELDPEFVQSDREQSKQDERERWERYRVMPMHHTLAELYPDDE
jgi:hypothetical protein